MIFKNILYYKIHQFHLISKLHVEVNEFQLKLMLIDR